MKFSPITLDRFRNARFQGFRTKPEAIGLGGSFKTGRFAIIGLLCRENRITEARFESFNCISVIAAADWVCETLQNKSPQAALKITVDSILEALDGLPDSRLFCAHLAHEALQAAVVQAQKKGLLLCVNSP